MLVNHVADLDRKLGSARFNVDQLQVGRNAFMNMLTESLKEQPSEVRATRRRRCLTAVLSLLTQLSRYARRAAMTWMRPS
jgi:hypothetical protein